MCSGGGKQSLKATIKDPLSAPHMQRHFYTPEGSVVVNRTQSSFCCFVWVGYLNRVKNLKSHSTPETFFNKNAALTVQLQGQRSHHSIKKPSLSDRSRLGVRRIFTVNCNAVLTV